MIATRLNITYFVNLLNQLTQCPWKCHVIAILIVLRHLHEFSRKGLLFRRNNEMIIKGHIDVDCARDVNDHRSTYGYYFYVGDNLVTWKSKKQLVAACSSIGV